MNMNGMNPNMMNMGNMGMNMPNMGMNIPNMGNMGMNMPNMANMGNFGMNTMNMGNMGNMNMMNMMNMMNLPNMAGVPMVALPTMNTMMSIEDNQGWNLLFEDQRNRKIVNIRISEQKTVNEAISAFKLKINDFNNKFKFVFNNKELFPDMKICQSGLTNGAKILVISTRYLKGAK